MMDKVFIIVGFLVVVLIWTFLPISNNNLVNPCSEYITLVPPRPTDVDKCGSVELSPGQTLILKTDNNQEYVIKLSGNAIWINHPDFESTLVYNFPTIDRITDTLAVGDIIIQRYMGDWYVRFYPTWKIVG